jgi:hypothetical protein
MRRETERETKVSSEGRGRKPKSFSIEDWLPYLIFQKGRRRKGKNTSNHGAGALKGKKKQQKTKKLTKRREAKKCP